MSAANNLQKAAPYAASVVEWHRRAVRNLARPLGVTEQFVAGQSCGERLGGRGLLLWLIGIPLDILVVVIRRLH
jgi:hypothetical protein